MEIKELVKNLEIVNDLNNMTEDELKEKYTSTLNNYEQFLDRYSDYFLNHHMYQLRAAENYNKIYSIIISGNAMYRNESIFENSNAIRYEIERTKDRFRVNDKGQSKDVYEAQALFLDGVGALKANKTKEYKEVVSDIYSSAERYNNRDNNTIDDFPNYVNYVLRAAKSGAEFSNAINKYIQNHSRLEECNSMSYLYFVNYMLTCNKSKIDGSFIHDAEAILLSSKVMRHLGNVKQDFDLKSYEKLEKHTKKNIKYYYKNQEKQEKEIKKYSKNFLRK